MMSYSKDDYSYNEHKHGVNCDCTWLVKLYCPEAVKACRRKNPEQAAEDVAKEISEKLEAHIREIHAEIEDKKAMMIDDRVTTKINSEDLSALLNRLAGMPDGRDKEANRAHAALRESLESYEEECKRLTKRHYPGPE